jgi:hypothetical protein
VRVTMRERTFTLHGKQSGRTTSQSFKLPIIDGNVNTAVQWPAQAGLFTSIRVGRGKRWRVCGGFAEASPRPSIANVGVFALDRKQLPLHGN